MVNYKIKINDCIPNTKINMYHYSSKLKFQFSMRLDIWPVV